MTKGSYRLAACGVAVLVAGACTSGSGTSTPSTPTTENLAPTTTSTGPVTTIPRASATTDPDSSPIPVVPPVSGLSFGAEDVFVRGCDSQIFAGEASVNPADRLGPLVLWQLSKSAPQLETGFLTPSADGELGIQKYGTQLDGDQAAWLVIAAEDRAHASLIYDPARWSGNQDGRLPLTAGDPAVRFDACGNPSGHSVYNGGILVDGPRCITLEVWVEPEAGPVATVPVQFGREADCAFIRQSLAIKGEDRVEVPFDSPGLDWTSSTVTVVLSRSADVELSIQATQGTLHVLDGSAVESSACRSIEAGGLECVIQWPVLEAQSAGQWTLVAENRSPEHLEIEFAIEPDQAISG